MKKWIWWNVCIFAGLIMILQMCADAYAVGGSRRAIVAAMQLFVFAAMIYSRGRADQQEAQ